MGFIQDLYDLLRKYEDNDNRQEGEESGNERDDRRGDWGQIVERTGHHILTPVGLTFNDTEHCFTVEKIKKVIPYLDIKNIYDKYKGKIIENKNYENILPDDYDSSQLKKDIEENWVHDVYRHLDMILDMSKHMFFRYFKLHDHNYDGTGLYFLPSEIKRRLNDEGSFKKREEEFFERGMNNSKILLEGFRRIANSNITIKKDLEDQILQEIYMLSGHGIDERKKWSHERAGVGIGGYIAVYEKDWKEICTLWSSIIASNKSLFDATRFNQNPDYTKHYSAENGTFFDAINNIFMATDIKYAWIKFNSYINAVFYNRPMDY